MHRTIVVASHVYLKYQAHYFILLICHSEMEAKFYTFHPEPLYKLVSK